MFHLKKDRNPLIKKNSETKESFKLKIPKYRKN